MKITIPLRAEPKPKTDTSVPATSEIGLLLETTSRQHPIAGFHLELPTLNLLTRIEEVLQTYRDTLGQQVLDYASETGRSPEEAHFDMLSFMLTDDIQRVRRKVVKRQDFGAIAYGAILMSIIASPPSRFPSLIQQIDAGNSVILRAPLRGSFAVATNDGPIRQAFVSPASLREAFDTLEPTRWGFDPEENT